MKGDERRSIERPELFLPSGVFHITVLTYGQGAGTIWATGTQTGDFTLVPDDPTQPTYTGHLTVWFGDNDSLHNGTETATFNIPWHQLRWFDIERPRHGAPGRKRQQRHDRV